MAKKLFTGPVKKKERDVRLFRTPTGNPRSPDFRKNSGVPNYESSMWHPMAPGGIVEHKKQTKKKYPFVI